MTFSIMSKPPGFFFTGGHDSSDEDLIALVDDKTFSEEEVFGSYEDVTDQFFDADMDQFFGAGDDDFVFDENIDIELLDKIML